MRNHIVFVMIHCTETITDYFFATMIFCLCSSNRIIQSMHCYLDHLWSDLIIPLYHSILIKVPTSD